MTESKRLSVPRWGLWITTLTLGAALSACAHPVVVEPVLDVRAYAGPTVMQYSYSASPAPQWVQPPIVVPAPVIVPRPVLLPRPVLSVPVYPVYPAYRPSRGYGGRAWAHGEHEGGHWGHHGY